MAPSQVGDVTELAQRVEQLEVRLRKLEERLGEVANSSAPAVEASATSLPQPLPDAGRLIPLAGQALLILAGAYLLRALATSSLAPSWVGIALALAYAAFWMFRATRLAPSNTLAATVYMTTAVLSLSPMLWETTVRFHLMRPSTTAAVLAGFVILSFSLSWKQRISATAWLAAAAGAVTALALAFGTDDLLALCAALLAIAFTLEIAASQDLWLGPRCLAAFAADFAVLWLVYVYSGSQLPESYQPIPGLWHWAIPAALCLLYAIGTSVRVLGRKRDVSIFEISQVTVSFSLFIFAATRGIAGKGALGVVLALSGVASYAVSFLLLNKPTRNLYAYSLFAFVLVLLGTAFFLPPAGVPLVWALAASGFAVLGAREHGLAAFHALGFLTAAALASGVALQTFSVLLRDGTKVALTPASVLVLAAMIASYIRLRGIPRNIAATMLAWVLAAWVASLLLNAAPAGADAAWRAEIRTILLIATAVVAAAVGRRWERPELYWLAPGAMVIALYRLIAEDFPSRPLRDVLPLVAFLRRSTAAAVEIHARLAAGMTGLRSSVDGLPSPRSHDSFLRSHRRIEALFFQ